MKLRLFSEKRMNNIKEIIRKYPNKFFNLDYWRVTINIELNNKHQSMSNAQLSQLLVYFYRKGFLKRKGKIGYYLYKYKGK